MVSFLDRERKMEGRWNPLSMSIMHVPSQDCFCSISTQVSGPQPLPTKMQAYLLLQKDILIYLLMYSGPHCGG